MKTVKTKLFALALLAFFACNDDNNDESPAVANDEAAEMIATSVSSSSGGLTMVMDDAAITTEANSGGRMQACGYTESKDITRTSPEGATVIYAYDFHYDYALTCSNALPTNMTVNMNYSGLLDAPRLFTENEGIADLVVETLDATYTHFTLNGSYNRSGSFVSKVRNKNTSSSVITFTLSDVTLDKTTREITAGSASITITGTVTGKGDFSFNGTIVFKGDKQAELEVNGVKYAVDLESGEVTVI